MTRFGIEHFLYHCPEVTHKVVLHLYYGTHRGKKIYSSLDCESKEECVSPLDERGFHDWEKCPAYKVYINPENK
jgi:hypothetical protein